MLNQLSVAIKESELGIEVRSDRRGENLRSQQPGICAWLERDLKELLRLRIRLKVERTGRGSDRRTDRSEIGRSRERGSGIDD